MKDGPFTNQIFKYLTAAASASVLLIILAMLVTLILESYPAMSHFGLFNFLTTADWNYSAEIFGAVRPLFGTFLSTILALIVAVPVALGMAIFLTELCPDKLRSTIGTTLELLAAIPSIIYGMWGLFILAPFLETYFQPLITQTLGQLPIIGDFFKAKLAGGVNLFTASMILSVMIIPFISSIAREAMTQVPPMLKESSYGIGATRWETLRYVVIPYAKMAIAGGVILAMGRALGETMAVSYVIGNRHAALESIFSPYTTITSVLANEFNEAGGLQLSSLFSLALILFLANFLALTIAKRLLGGKKWTI
ncbi:MAG: phosphate ABC transporter permease subunit PstC [Deltaproteobacteria bacterium]|jgi:phosphate transport system permease protein|nr:phosphate ABC transporter permease subunit PstC [Deltaproteobacteria bacterium]